jgi:hypothetical protein
MAVIVGAYNCDLSSWSQAQVRQVVSASEMPSTGFEADDPPPIESVF